MSREKKETTKKQENREKYENVTETHELVLSNNWMEKEKITREEIRHKEKKQEEIKKEDVKTRWDQKRKWNFWTSWNVSDPCKLWSNIFSFDQQQISIFLISVLALSYLMEKLQKNNVNCFGIFSEKMWKGNSMNWKSKEANWQIESPRLSSSTKSTWRTTMKGSSFCPTTLGRRTGTTIRKERICQIAGRGECTLAVFWDGTRFTEKRMTRWFDTIWWSVVLMEEHGWRNEHEKRPSEKLRTRQDRSLRNRVVQFTNGAAQGGARTCRCATDSVHCSLWWKDKFPQYRVFRNSGACPNIQKEKERSIESSREACEEPDCMCSKNCVVWTATWAETSISVSSSPQSSFLPYVSGKCPFPPFSPYLLIS